MVGPLAVTSRLGDFLTSGRRSFLRAACPIFRVFRRLGRGDGIIYILPSYCTLCYFHTAWPLLPLISCFQVFSTRLTTLLGIGT